jgi:hypothetical protein
MPLMHKKDGWYWGSKGPFQSKAKALSVARAAFASGYKGEQKKDDVIVLEKKIPALLRKY